MIEERFQIPTTDGLQLEARLAYGEELASPRAKILLCPPHPFLGGDMENNVLSGLCAALAEAEFAVLRFNYRGIGGSETDRDLKQDEALFWQDSSCPDYEAKMHQDTHAVKEWFLSLEAETPFYIAGYSYGCLPAMNLAATEARIERCALIAPPLAKWAIDPGLLNHTKPKGLFYAPDDFACPADSIQGLYEQIAGPKQLIMIDGGEHFFVGKEAALAREVTGFFNSALADRERHCA